MRTVTFKHLYDRIIRRSGLDPLTDIGQAEARWVVDALNQRVAHIWPLAPFPELMLTQERGFREVWDSTKQYHALSATRPTPSDEVLWVNQAGTAYVYYRAKLNALQHDPPIGPLNSPPMVPTSWDVMDTVTSYLDFAVPRMVPDIGIAYGVYSTDPSLNNGQNLSGDVTRTFDALRFQPSQNGVRLIGSHGPTVFVWFEIQAPQYTIVPYIDNKAYAVGDRVYYPVDGRVYRCVSPQPALPLNLALWREEIVPDFFQGYLLAGTCADYLKQGKPEDPAAQVKLAMAQSCDAEATEKYQGLVDRLSIMGYKPKLQWPSMGCQQWLGDVVQPLYLVLIQLPGDDPQSPLQPVIPGVSWEYHPEINYLLTADGTPSLSGLTTTLKDPKSMCEVVIDGVGMRFQLVAGPADSGDPGQVAPDDYASVTNDKHWNKVL